MKHRTRMNIHFSSVFGVVIASFFSCAVVAADVLIEALAPVQDTKIELGQNYGKMFWLDNDVLAIGTFRTNINEFRQGKVVAYDTREKRSKDLRDNAFLQCTLPSSGIVAVRLGNFEDGRGGGAKDSIKPRSVFYQWNAKSRELSKETELPNGNWNWFLCRQVQIEDLNSPSVGFYGKGLRYLLPEDGILEWGNASRSADGQLVSWAKAGQVSKDLDLFSDEIALVPIYVPFANAYMLSSGKLAGEKAVMESHGKIVKQLPLVSMRRNGEIVRRSLSDDFVAQINAHHTSGGVTYLSAAGLIVATNRGVFVVKDQLIKRVWCGPNGLNGGSCDLVALDVSPDGCKIALAPKYASIQVVNVCAKNVP